MVQFVDRSKYRGAEKHLGDPALALRTPPMTTTLDSMEAREVVRCAFSDCRLTQFKTANCLCRRCHRPLEIEEPVRPGPVPVELHPMEPSAEAGLHVAGQVKEIRRARHLSQRQLAGRMQVPRTYISKIENGKAIPTLSSLDRLAEALGVDVRQLVRDARSQRDDEVASILADPLLAEIAALLPQLDSLHRSLLYGTARDMAASHRRIA
jgi:transcriptional regulator with XRE-family HTH domain